MHIYIHLVFSPLFLRKSDDSMLDRNWYIETNDLHVIEIIIFWILIKNRLFLLSNIQMDINNNLITFTYCLYLIQHFFKKKDDSRRLWTGSDHCRKKQHTCNPQTWVRFMFVCLVVDVVLGFFFWGGDAMSLSSFQYKSPKNLLHCLSEYYFVIKKKNSMSLNY